MKLTLIFLLLAVLLLGLTGCRLNYMEPAEMREFLDGIAENVGDSQLTGDEDLIGTRVLASDEDSYAGEYTAHCDRVTGRDVVFGGASILSRILKLEGRITAESGTVAVRIRMNGEVTELTPDADGWFMTEIHMESGGNYIMIDYTDFTGKSEMTCTYSDRADGENGEP